MNEQELLEKLEKQPQDIQTRVELAKLYFQDKNFEASLQILGRKLRRQKHQLSSQRSKKIKNKNDDVASSN